jgi:hypothetical protein
MQLTFLKADESDFLRFIDGLKDRQESLRRGIFQRYDTMQKELAELKSEIQEIKSTVGIVKEGNLF